MARQPSLDTMARQPKAKPATPAGSVKLRQPDRSAPSQATLLQLAAAAAQQQQQQQQQHPSHVAAPTTLSPAVERFLEATLWTATLAMLHLTFDVLVQNQYATELVWPSVCARTARAWLVFLFLFYVLHPHDSSPVLAPGLPLRYQRPLRQVIFFAASVVSGCYLIYISNTYGYLAIMKQAPPLGCIWLWAVVELDLAAAVSSLALAALFLWKGGYDIK